MTHYLTGATCSLALSLAAVFAFASISASAHSYPEKPITLVVASAPGGAGDNLARAVASELSKRLNQPVVVDNVPGASGAIGAQKVLKAPADGYTLLFGTTGDMVVAPIANHSAGYAPKDFTPIAKLTSAPMALVARAGLKIASFDELVAAARQKPGGMTIGVSGSSSLGAFGAAAIIRAAKIDLLTVPYKAAPPMMSDLLGGQIDLSVGALPGLIPHVRANKLTMLGLLSEQRSPVAPDWQTINESSAVKGVAVEVWGALAGPPNLPRPIVETINRAIQDTLREKTFVEARTKLGDTLAAPAPASDFGQFLAAEDSRYRTLASGMKLE